MEGEILWICGSFLKSWFRGSFASLGVPQANITAEVGENC